MSIDAAVESSVKRDRVVVLAALSTVVAICWAHLLAGAGTNMSAFEMTDMTAGGVGMDVMMRPAVWDIRYAALMFVMWWVMMSAMVLPSAAPMILSFALVNRRSRAKGGPYVPTAMFAGAHLVAWGGFSILAVALQWGLERAELLSPMMASRNAAFGGALLVLAGAYELSPLKHACLRCCRGPIDFISRHWRAGRRGAFRVGVHHGSTASAAAGR